ncbi:substrate-binding periplasmic protein [Terasakiella pusilla]|uniref:substrate-binding periplasmic protein n=1 Tax=Terasakiella pusilla TaxID=64973 RepID=UPI003AA99AA8
MALRRFLCFVLFVFMFPAHVLAGPPVQTLIIANSNWSPYKGEGLLNGGLITDITRQALVRMGYNVSVVTVPWKRALSGTYDGIYHVLPAVWYTQERAQRLTYGSGVLEGRIVIVTRQDNPFFFNDLSDLSGKRVGVAAGWAYPPAFMDAADIIKDEAHDLDSNLRKLAFGRLEYVIAEEIAARYTATKLFAEAAGFLNYSAKPLQKNTLHVAFSKKLANHEGLREKFQVEVEAMRRDGTVDLILKAHGVNGLKITE